MSKVKEIVLIVLLLLLVMPAFSIPAKPRIIKTIKLTDGQEVTARLVGDEYAHYWIGADGQAYQAVGDVYQRIDLQAVSQRAAARRAATNQRRTSRLVLRKVGEVGCLTGKKKGLIILVNFSDVAFQSANNNALYQRIANEKNFSYGNFKGSMYDYFYDQSEGQFELTFDVVGPVTVSKSQAYYGENDAYGNDMHSAEMVIEAIKLVDSQINFANYDWDGDGEVDQVYVVYAGKGEADGGAASTIWPHEYNLYSANHDGDGDGSQKLDGVWINTYACGGELNGQTGNIAGIGTMCHEFSHCLGYPDFYDIDGSGGQGMGYWDLMDSGNYNGDGYRPAGYTSYERWMAGWKEPIELTSKQDIVNMRALQNYGSNTYIIYNKGNRNEYFLLENRQKTKWDTDLPGAGLLILHVDYDAAVWARNEPNDDPNYQRLTWVPADNQYQYITYQGMKYYTEEGAANDPFPYGSVNAFGKNTTPAATLYNKNEDGTYYLDASVENIIQNSNGTISFRFAPEVKKLTLTATPASGTISYMQEVTLTASNPNAEIYYTFDGLEPTRDHFFYDSPLQIDGSVTMKAKAFLDGYEDSETLTREYQVKLDIAADRASGTVRAGQTVTLSSTHPEATIYYTTDGTTPNSQSDVYISRISIDSTMTLNAVAMHEGCLQSNLLTRNFTVRVVTLSVSPATSELLPVGTEITLTANPADAKIYYTIDGSEPTMASILYTEPIVANSSFTLRAKAYYDGYKESYEICQEYEISSLKTLANTTSGATKYKYFVPSISFNDNILPSEAYDNITLQTGGVIISGECIIDENTLYFVPNNCLSSGSYTLSVPNYALMNNKGEKNIATKLEFSIKKTVEPIVSSFGQFSIALDDEGQLWTWGYNLQGQLGNNISEECWTPVKVLDGVVYCSAGGEHALAIKEDYSLWAWGDNNSGQLGIGNTNGAKKVPTKITNNVIAVSAGYKHSLAIKSDNTLWAWGYNNYGSVGDGKKVDVSSPKMIKDNIQGIAAGYNYSLAISNDGSLWAWGYNAYGQLGNGTTTHSYVPIKVLENVIAISAYNHSMAIKSDGSLWTWGYNGSGQLGDGTQTNRVHPVKVLDDVIAISAGSSYSMAIKSDGSLWGWGSNSYGLYGGETTTSSLLPIKLCDNVKYACPGRVILNDGSLLTWGNNVYGQLGNGSSDAVPVKVMDNVKSISAGKQTGAIVTRDGSFEKLGIRPNVVMENIMIGITGTDDKLLLAIKDDNTLWVQGAYPIGRNMSKNYESPTQIFESVTSVASGSTHILAIKEDKSLWAWGDNYEGQIGNGGEIGKSTSFIETPTKIQDDVVSIATSRRSSFSIKSDGSLWAWGDNQLGQLGDGTKTNRNRPVKIMNDVKFISAGNGRTLAIKNDGSLYAWGWWNNWSGDGSGTTRTSPVKIMDDVVFASVGENHNMIVKTDGSLWTWGGNSFGQMGNGTRTNTTAQFKIMDDVACVAAGGTHSMAIKNDGSLWTWGGGNGGGADLGKGTLPKSSIMNLLSNVNINSLQLKATYYVQQNNKIYIEPTFNEDKEDVTYEIMTWTSSNENIATVSSRGVVTGIAPGETTLTVKVTSKDGTVFTAQCEVTVTDNIKGDVNGDNVVDRDDAIAVANYVMKKPSPSFNVAAADVNGDGVINITDAIAIENIIKKNK